MAKHQASQRGPEWGQKEVRRMEIQWICPKGFRGNKSPHFIAPQFDTSRCQLNYVEEYQVTWQPYLASVEYIFPRASRWICPKDYCKNDSPQFIGPCIIRLRCQLNYVEESQGSPTRNLNCRGVWHTAVELYRDLNDQYKELFVAAGFGDFLKIEPVDVPVAYNLALTERLFHETNTLHLPGCEIGPTPVDWTMVTGLSFGGCRKANLEFKMERALDLLGKPGAIRDGKIHLEKIKPDPREVSGIPPTDDAKEKLFRGLFLYVVSSCFFNKNRSVISHNLVECLERINEVGSYDWGQVTYAAFLAGMRRKVTEKIGAFTAFWQFLPFWAFEYLDVNRPNQKEGNIFPRASRWICPKGYCTNDSPQFIGPRFIGSRCQLNFVEESEVTWQPYLASAEYGSDAVQYAINLAKMRIPFQSIDTWEYYLGERCLQQIGFPCRVPSDPPKVMHGICWDIS